MSNVYKNGLTLAVFITSTVFFVNGCAAPTNQTQRNNAALTGTPSTSSSAANKALDPATAKAFSEAESLLKKGDKLISKGEKRLADGREQVSDGEDLIKKGNNEVRESRDRYQTLARASGSASNPDQVFDEAKRFKKVADAWEDAEDDIEDGNDLVEKGNKTISKAQQEIAEGRKITDSAKTTRRNLERDQLNKELLEKQSGMANDLRQQQ